VNLACGLLLAATIAVAWPIWRYLHEHSMFTRRVMLAGVTREESRVRRWFWAGRIARVGQVFAAFAWATALVAYAHLLSKWHWAALALDAVLVAAAAGWVMRRMAGEVRAGQLGLAARRWPLAIGNVVVLAAVFMAIGFFAGAPDTRGLAWNDVAEKAFAQGSARAACDAIAPAVGALATIDALAWHAAQVLIPSLPDAWLRLAVWIVFLLQAGVVALAYTRFLLGIGTALDRDAAVSSRGFVAVAVVIVAVAVALALRGGELFAPLADGARGALRWADPCRTDPSTAQALRASLKAELDAARLAEHRRADERAGAAVDELYAGVEKGVDAYLDWYFTVLGEYQRLAALAGGRFAESMEEQLESRIFGEDFARRLDEASAALATESAGRVRAIGTGAAQRLELETSAHPCWAASIRFPQLPQVRSDVLSVSTSVGTGAVVGMVVARAAARTAARQAAARAAGKPAFRSAAALAGRVTAKRTGSLGAGAAGAAACGPLAPLCALVAAGVTWFALDYAMVGIDEKLYREDMRRDLLEAAREQQAALKAVLVQKQQAEIDKAINDIDASLEKVFVPARQGI
jgi:hypothetical protein